MPRAIWIALLSVGALVMLNAVAATLAHPDPASVVAGEDPDPVTTAVVSAFGSWSEKPFAAIVLIAFLACGMAAQSLTARTMYSLSRDGVLPASRSLRVGRPRGTCRSARSCSRPSSRCLGLLLGLNSAAVGSLITFGTAAIYVSFFLIALAALIARVAGAGSRWAVRSGGGLSERAGGRRGSRSRRSTSRGRALARAAGRAGLPGLGGAAVHRRRRRARALLYLVVARPTGGPTLGNADPADLGGAGAPGDEAREQAERRVAVGGLDDPPEGVAAGEAGRVRRRRRSGLLKPLQAANAVAHSAAVCRW